MSGPSCRLLAGYDAVVLELERLLDALDRGDRAELGFYLIEPGGSSERVLAAVRRAALRGARVTLSLDASLASLLSRVVEGSGTLRADVLALARAHATVRAVARRGMDHSKYAVAIHANGREVALVGGVNLGDRFRAWRDFAVRLEGAGVAASVLEAVRGRGPSPWPLRERAWSLVANAPRARRYDVRPFLDALAADRSVVRLRVAMAYVDLPGARVLARALARGAAVDLVVPARPNVYRHANPRALAWLLRNGPGDSLRIFASPHMLHAKVFLAERAAAERTAAERTAADAISIVGSANLKRNSFSLFGELGVVATDRGLAAALGHELSVLARESEPVTRAPSFSAALAAIEDCFG